ncbi:MAG: demethoxyubiquinone hydroxylase family protein [Azospirillaceae bacterium]
MATKRRTTAAAGAGRPRAGTGRSKNDRTGTGRTQPGAGRPPGEPRGHDLIDRVVRVDHAGEYGARRIYEGQLAVLRHSAKRPVIEHMAEQEARHLAAFEKLLVERGARPSLLHPLGHVAGFALGAGTALLGERAAMACTVAVEEVIDEHYAAQAEALRESEPELAALIEDFQGEEAEHRDLGLAHEAEQAPAYQALSVVIRRGSRAAIWLAERF